MARNSARRSSRALFGKPSSTVLLLRCADDEPLTALRAPPLEDVAAGLGGVALAEPVLLVPPDLAGLVRALHDDGLLTSRKKRGNQSRTVGSVNRFGSGFRSDDAGRPTVGVCSSDMQKSLGAHSLMQPGRRRFLNSSLTPTVGRPALLQPGFGA